MRKKLLLIFLLCLPHLLGHAADILVYDLRVENLTNPLGLDASSPRFSWKISSYKKNTLQTAYEIIVSSSQELLSQDKGDLWESGLVSSRQQLWVTYQGKRLPDNQHAYWKVRIRTNKGNSQWSEAQTFSIGLLGETHWKGRWIGLESLQPGDCQGMHTRLAARYLRN